MLSVLDDQLVAVEEPPVERAAAGSGRTRFWRIVRRAPEAARGR